MTRFTSSGVDRKVGVVPRQTGKWSWCYRHESGALENAAMESNRSKNLVLQLMLKEVLTAISAICLFRGGRNKNARQTIMFTEFVIQWLSMQLAFTNITHVGSLAYWRPTIIFHRMSRSNQILRICPYEFGTFEPHKSLDDVLLSITVGDTCSWSTMRRIKNQLIDEFEGDRGINYVPELDRAILWPGKAAGGGKKSKTRDVATV
ncbi:hypothetical protein C5167_026071 [Papaver somniferum]|nr:hypothetical protein C5167_026071 [Papaver somniferum]